MGLISSTIDGGVRTTVLRHGKYRILCKHLQSMELFTLPKLSVLSIVQTLRIGKKVAVCTTVIRLR